MTTQRTIRMSAEENIFGHFFAWKQCSDYVPVVNGTSILHIIRHVFRRVSLSNTTGKSQNNNPPRVKWSACSIRTCVSCVRCKIFVVWQQSWNSQSRRRPKRKSIKQVLPAQRGERQTDGSKTIDLLFMHWRGCNLSTKKLFIFRSFTRMWRGKRGNDIIGLYSLRLILFWIRSIIVTHRKTKMSIFLHSLRKTRRSYVCFFFVVLFRLQARSNDECSGDLAPANHVRLVVGVLFATFFRFIGSFNFKKKKRPKCVFDSRSERVTAYHRKRRLYFRFSARDSEL